MRPCRLHLHILTLLLLASCGHAPADRPGSYMKNGHPDLLHFQLAQKTCALFVAPHTAALGPVGFGRDIDDDMVRWNTCPGGSLVACKKVATAEGDSVITGLPKPVPRLIQE
ncbi:MAG TPA: hypothetical protein PKN30_05055 [Flavobacteriales bacterium]|nr:hypothetical protein [Flavobacteriales bacterium]